MIPFILRFPLQVDASRASASVAVLLEVLWSESHSSGMLSNRRLGRDNARIHLDDRGMYVHTFWVGLRWVDVLFECRAHILDHLDVPSRWPIRQSPNVAGRVDAVLGPYNDF